VLPQLILIRLDAIQDCSGNSNWWDPIITCIQERRPKHDDDALYMEPSNPAQQWHVNITAVEQHWWDMIEEWSSHHVSPRLHTSAGVDPKHKRQRKNHLRF
jgi:hypothetical protein